MQNQSFIFALEILYLFFKLGQSTGNVTLQSPGCFDDGRTFHELLHALGKTETKDWKCRSARYSKYLSLFF